MVIFIHSPQPTYKSSIPLWGLSLSALLPHIVATLTVWLFVALIPFTFSFQLPICCSLVEGGAVNKRTKPSSATAWGQWTFFCMKFSECSYSLTPFCLEWFALLLYSLFIYVLVLYIFRSIPISYSCVLLMYFFYFLGLNKTLSSHSPNLSIS